MTCCPMLYCYWLCATRIHEQVVDGRVSATTPPYIASREKDVEVRWEEVPVE